MLLAEEVLLLAYDDETGRPDWHASSTLDHALAGAVLIELTELGRVALEGEGRRSRLAVPDDTPTGHPVLDEWLPKVAAAAGRRPKDAVAKLHPRLRRRLLEELADRGVLRKESGTTLLVFPRTSWPAADTAHEERLRRRLRDVLVTGTGPDERTAAVIGLLHAIKAVDRVVPREDRRAARARAKEIAAGSWASEATRKAVEEMTTAVMTAVTVSAAAAGAAGS